MWCVKVSCYLSFLASFMRVNGKIFALSHSRGLSDHNMWNCETQQMWVISKTGCFENNQCFIQPKEIFKCEELAEIIGKSVQTDSAGVAKHFAFLSNDSYLRPSIVVCAAVKEDAAYKPSPNYQMYWQQYLGT